MQPWSDDRSKSFDILMSSFCAMIRPESWSSFFVFFFAKRSTTELKMLQLVFRDLLKLFFFIFMF